MHAGNPGRAAARQGGRLAGKEKPEVSLIPPGDKLEAKGAFKIGPGTKVVAVVSKGGKPIGTARFALK